MKFKPLSPAAGYGVSVAVGAVSGLAKDICGAKYQYDEVVKDYNKVAELYCDCYSAIKKYESTTELEVTYDPMKSYDDFGAMPTFANVLKDVLKAAVVREITFGMKNISLPYLENYVSAQEAMLEEIVRVEKSVFETMIKQEKDLTECQDAISEITNSFVTFGEHFDNGTFVEKLAANESADAALVIVSAVSTVLNYIAGIFATNYLTDLVGIGLKKFKDLKAPEIELIQEIIPGSEGV